METHLIVCVGFCRICGIASKATEEPGIFSVPHSDGVVLAHSHHAPAIWRECHGEDLAFVAKQCRNGLAVPSIPNARTSIVTRRQNPGSVGRVYRLVYRSSMASQREQ